MVKEQKTTSPIFTATTVGILIVGLLAVLSVNVIPLQQATALFGYSISGPEGSGPRQGGDPIGSTQDEQNAEEQQHSSSGCPINTHLINSSKGRCFHP